MPSSADAAAQVEPVLPESPVVARSARDRRARPRPRARHRAAPGRAEPEPELFPAAAVPELPAVVLPELPFGGAGRRGACRPGARAGACSGRGGREGAVLQEGIFAQARPARAEGEGRAEAQGEASRAQAQGRAQAEGERKRKAKAVPEAEGAPAEPTTVAGDKVPFYKRDFSFKRSPKQWDAAEPAPSKPKALRAAAPEAFALESFAAGKQHEEDRRPQDRRLADRCRRINNGSTPELVQVVRGPLDHGIVVGGELRDPEALAVELRDFFKRHNLPKRGIRLGIANNRIGVRTFEVTGIADPKQLANAIRFRAQEVLPIPLEEAVLDYQVLSEQRHRGRPARSGGCSSSSPIASSSTATSRRARRRVCRSSESTSRRSRCCGPSPSRTIRCRTRSGAPSSRSRSATTARPSPSRTGASASSRACSSGAAGR